MKKGNRGQKMGDGRAGSRAGKGKGKREEIGGISGEKEEEGRREKRGFWKQ